MEKKVYNFTSIQDFYHQIKKIDISVPLRSQRRRTEHTERYSIISFLQNFIIDNLFDFPLDLIHRDRPDFYIKTLQRDIGVEFTESIPEQLARANALLEEHFPNGILEPEFFGWEPERSNDEILEILSNTQKKGLVGEGWFGNSLEEQWSYGIISCIMNKTKKLNKVDFRKFEENWLLIYDNQIKVFLDKEYVSKKIKTAINNYWENEEDIKFDKIFIESGAYWYTIEKNIVEYRKRNLI